MDKAYDIINSKHYFKLLEKGDKFSEEEKKEINDFQEYINSCLEYYDYLLPEKKVFVDEYKQEMYKLSIKEQEDPYAELNNLQNNEISKYAASINKVKVRTLNKKESAGFANAFVIAFTLIITGFVIGASLFFFL